MPVEPVSPDIVENVKRFIVASKDIDTFGKQAVLYLIDRSKQLSRACQLKANNVDLGRSTAFGVHDMNSANGTTHIHNLLDALGIQGSFHSRTDSGPKWVIWFSPESVYNHHGREIKWDERKIKAVDLKPYCSTEELVVEGCFLTPSSLAALQGANLVALTIVNNLTRGLDCPARIGFRWYQYQPIGRGARKYPMIARTQKNATLFIDLVIEDIKGVWKPVSADLTYRPYGTSGIINSLSGKTDFQVSLKMSKSVRSISFVTHTKDFPNPRSRHSV